MSYQCQHCNKTYSIKQSYERHMLTISHIKRTDVNRKIYKCECGRSYLYRQSLYNHKMECNNTPKNVRDQENEDDGNAKIDAMQKQIDELKLAVQHSKTNVQTQTAKKITNNENSHNTNNTQNIHINCYGKEDLSYITKEFLTELISTPFTSIQDLTRHIYFNEEHPENQNVKITNKKLPYASIHKNGKWELTDRKRIAEDIMQKNYNLIDSNYDEVATELSDNKKIRYERFQGKYDTPEQQRQIIKEVELYLLGGGQL